MLISTFTWFKIRLQIQLWSCSFVSLLREPDTNVQVWFGPPREFVLEMDSPRCPSPPPPMHVSIYCTPFSMHAVTEACVTWAGRQRSMKAYLQIRSISGKVAESWLINRDNMAGTVTHRSDLLIFLMWQTPAPKQKRVTLDCQVMEIKTNSQAASSHFQVVDICTQYSRRIAQCPAVYHLYNSV